MNKINEIIKLQILYSFYVGQILWSLQDVVRRFSVQLHEAGDVYDDASSWDAEQTRQLLGGKTWVESDRPRRRMATSGQRRRLSKLPGYVYCAYMYSGILVPIDRFPNLFILENHRYRCYIIYISIYLFMLFWYLTFLLLLFVIYI